LPLEPRGHGRAEAERTWLSLLHPDPPPRAAEPWPDPATAGGHPLWFLAVMLQPINK
jgi:hypothetical protein